MNQLEAIIKLEKKLNAVRSLADEAISELVKLKEEQAPETPRKRRNLKQERIDAYALSIASGKWGMGRVSKKLVKQNS